MDSLTSGILKYYKRIPFIVVLVLCFIFIFLFFLHPVTGDGDFFHHLNTGRYIIQHLQLPQVDEWTFTTGGKPWIANAWGTGVIYYLLFINFGPTAISVFVSSQAVLLFALLYLLLQSYQKNNITNLVTLMLGFSIISTRWPNRPELATYPFIVSILLIDRIKDKYPSIALLLPILIALWSILYVGSVFIGLILLIILLVRQFHKDKFIVKNTQKVFYISSIIAIPLSLLNGYGLKSLFYVFLTPAIAEIQGEWAGIFTVLTRASPDQLLQIQYEILLFFTYLFLFISLVIYKRKSLLKYPLELLLSLGLITPFFAIRNISLAVLLSLPLFVILFSSLDIKVKKPAFIGLIFILLLFLSISWKINQHGIGQDEISYPPDIIEFFRQNKLSGNVFTNQQTGSYISYYLYPSILVYSDTRDDLFVNTSVLSDFKNTISTSKNVIPLLNKYGADMVLANVTDGNSYQPLLYNKDWSLVYVNDKYLLFVKKKIAEEKNLPGFVAIDPYPPSASKTGLEDQAILEYEKIISSNYSFNNIFRLGLVLLDQKKYDQTIAVANQLIIPQNFYMPLFASRKDYLLATSYLLTHQCDNAKKFLDDYQNDLSNKFLFNWQERLPGVSEKEYVIYYLTCAYNVQKAQQHLSNYLNDPLVSETDKIDEESIYNKLINQLNLFPYPTVSSK